MDVEQSDRFFNRCDPNESLGNDDRRYEPFDDSELRGEAPRHRLAAVAEKSVQPTTQLLSGLTGSGKTTELRRLARALRERGFFVCMTDVVDRTVPLIDRSQPLLVVDTLLAVCYAIVESLSLEHRPSEIVGERFKQVCNHLNATLKLPSWI